jgi:hypothetical protein
LELPLKVTKIAKREDTDSLEQEETGQELDSSFVLAAGLSPVVWLAG